MDHQKISYSVADGIAVIELNDPPANTYSYWACFPAREARSVWRGWSARPKRLN
jgi:hypothetical protein